jgi:formate dehydrogenase major subunit
MKETVDLTIDGIQTEASSRETILSAATRLGIKIPTLCYLEGKTGLESCGLCMVEVESRGDVIPACASRVQEGMVIRTDTENLRKGRRLALELLLSDHLGDCIAPCEVACPASIDIPEFIRHIRYGNYAESERVIREAIAFPGVLGRVCPKFCEGVCRRGEYDEAVSICALKRFPADSIRDKLSQLPLKKAPTGKHVSIVGAGIVGLTAAYYLLLEGNTCTVYESDSRLGGAIRNVIPQFRLPSETVEEEIDCITSLGLDIRCNQALGVDFTLDELQNRSDAILLAIGATLETLPQCPGSEKGVPCFDFLQKVSHGHTPRVTGHVLVYGSGPAALDTSRTLLRLGADRVTLAMNPSIKTRLFFSPFVSYGLAEGIQILDETTLVSIEQREDGSFLCVLKHLGEVTPVDVTAVYLAGSMEPDIALLESQGLKTTKHGVQIDRHRLTTNLPGVFAAGSIAQSGRYAVHGSASGKQAAHLIHRFLMGESHAERELINVRMHHVTEEEKKILWGNRIKSVRLEESRLPGLEVKGSFDEVVRGLVPEAAKREAERCLQCDCAKKKNCSLRIQSTECEANPKAFRGDRPPLEIDDSHEDVIYEAGKCIKCGRCIAVADEKGAPLGLSYIGRGFQVKVGVPLNQTIQMGLRKVALECADVCPTGALARKR